MQMWISLREMLGIHFLVGAVFTIWLVLRAKKRNNQPPRGIFNFGDGLLGQTGKWIQWYSWCLSFEIITSLMYIHTGMFYYEIAMSFFESLAMILGAFVIDRFADFFLGDADITLPRPNIDLSKPVNAAMDGIKKTADAGKQAYSDYKARSTEAAEKQKEENLATARAITERFEELTKGR